MAFGIGAIEWLARSIGANNPRDIDMVRMKGSTSSAMFLIECLHDCALQHSVLRVLDKAE